MFTGELNVLSGRRGLVSIRAAEAGELIELEREALRTLVQTDSELSDIFLRAFIVRRIGRCVVHHAYSKPVYLASLP
jgi:thioredoxin reductase (NADPH)